MNGWKSYKNELLAYRHLPKFERMIKTAALLTELLERENIRPIVVGGLSMEIYTLNQYTTHDLDLVLSGRERAGQILSELGFQQLGKNWLHRELGLSLEIPDDVLAGDYNRVTRIPINGRHIYVIGIEDLLLDRLRAAVHWRSHEDREWGYRLLLMYDDLDLDYITAQLTFKEEKEEWQEWLKAKEKDSRLD